MSLRLLIIIRADVKYRVRFFKRWLVESKVENHSNSKVDES